jgi:hypothetical protein
LGRTESARQIANEPWSSMQREKRTNKTTLSSEWRSALKKSLTESALLEMSGYTDDAVLVRQGLPENSAFIRKPYTPQQFLQKVRESLDATPRRAH